MCCSSHGASAFLSVSGPFLAGRATSLGEAAPFQDCMHAHTNSANKWHKGTAIRLSAPRVHHLLGVWGDSWAWLRSWTLPPVG